MVNFGVFNFYWRKIEKETNFYSARNSNDSIYYPPDTFFLVGKSCFIYFVVPTLSNIWRVYS
jgi:hypothetical protein